MVYNLLMRIVLLDDDKRILAELRHDIEDFFRINKLPVPQIDCLHNGQALLADQTHFDILFLDIEMPEVSGIDIGYLISEKYPDTLIFVLTSYIEYLDDAMRFHVYRYLTKPIDRQRLFRNLNDAMNDLEERKANCENTVLLNRGGVSHHIPVGEIIYIEATGHSITLHTSKGDFNSPDSLNEWESRLDPRYFYRSNRSYIVNLSYVSDFTADKIYLCNSTIQALLTIRKFPDFKKHFHTFIKSRI